MNKDESAVSFAWIILVIAFIAASILFLVIDEIVQPMSGIYGNSSRIYNQTNPYDNMIGQYWLIYPIVLIIIAFIYGQVQSQKRI